MYQIDGIEQDDQNVMHQACLAVLQYWQERSRYVGGIPKLVDIDLMDLWQHASYITIKDIERDIKTGALRFRWRYAGTKLYELAGQELTGQYLDDVFDAGDTVFTIEERIAISGFPHYGKRSLQNKSANQQPVNYECLTLPLTNSQGEIGHTLSIIIWSDENLEGDKPSLYSNGRNNKPFPQNTPLITL